MGFRINTNISALSSYRNVHENGIGLDKSLRSLASGLKINNASDNGSGLTIADSLRQQAQGLGQSITNANDGIAIAQIADGAITEYTNIINIVRTKSIQAASDGQSLATRATIQEDIDKLMQEAQNLVSTTSFNDMTLLNGGYQHKSFHVGAYSGETIRLSISDIQTQNVGKFSTSDSTVIASTTVGDGITSYQLSLSATAADGSSINIDTGSYTIAAGNTSSEDNTQILVDKFNQAAQVAGADIRASSFETSVGGEFGIRLDSGGDFTIGTQTGVSGLVDTNADLSNSFANINVRTQDGAEKAIITADYTLRDIAKVRSHIGSVQNSLESTIRNVSVTQINVAAAESQIRDVDFADESANFAKYNILAQSGSYAMSQANTSQQHVLNLFR